ncbi:peroxisomal membrane anchor protein conserved region-domain-containing protein [Lasiosphaeria hispida]|uniref:Peroxisomal membrane protein PEX14 n=1 Tax=Lasiosphaeria hispida TaxID=260671 RepID=A0AAJ0H8P2_9PEZI|nr:peroxisomal membrane anchor protein conserved region-domain-containing protein [Lasiosphaeria hispida]
MSDAEENPKSDVPTWQKTQAPAPESVTESSQSPVATLEQARKFVWDPAVQTATKERKSEFLRTKGVSQADIDELLKDDALEPQAEPHAAVTQDKPVPPASELKARSESPLVPRTLEKKDDRPPIITYPEFLTKPTRPPPLMTATGFFNTLYAFGGFATLLYGTSKFVLEPMVASLTEARISLHDTAKEDLVKLVDKLEGLVSEIPPHKAALTAHTNEGDYHDEDDAKSSYEDPTELFHRDIGVQTSLPSTPLRATTPEPEPPEPASTQQARRVAELVASVRAISDGLVAQSEAYGDVRESVVGVFRDELDVLSSARSGANDFGYPSYGNVGGRNEPDDEIKKARDNIRRVKGVLLSTRSFPASTR